MRCAQPFQQTPRNWLCQSAGGAPCKGVGAAERSPRSLGVSQSKRAAALQCTLVGRPGVDSFQVRHQLGT